jgi:hypothetical protein
MFVAALLVYVMQRVEDDRWSKIDPQWLQWLQGSVRRYCDYASLLHRVIGQEFTCFLLVSGAAVILQSTRWLLIYVSPPNRGEDAARTVWVFSIW